MIFDQMASFATTAWLLGCALSLSGLGNVAVAQKTAPSLTDAQVEANVLRALAGAPELAGEDVHTRTVYGVVSLSGYVHDDVLRTHAENLAANAEGVKKVVDEMQLGEPPEASAAGSGSIPGPADGAASTRPESGREQAQQDEEAAYPEPPGSNQPPYPGPPQQNPGVSPQNPGPSQQEDPGNRPLPPGPGNDAGYHPGYGIGSDPNYPGAPEYGRYPADQRSRNQQPHGPESDYPDARSHQPDGGYGWNGPDNQSGGQAAGQSVEIPQGTTIRVRLNQSISSDHSTPGSSFDGVVASDVVADNAVAVPRGAQVHGTVVEATHAGVLKGRGDLTLSLNSVTLGGRTYPLVSDRWSHHGGDKTIGTVNKTAGLGAVGAVFGALAGGGEGAAIGGGIGAAAGLGSSAASHDGQVYLPAEALLSFRLVEKAAVTTVSEQEMQRLAYGAPPAAGPHSPRRPLYPRVYVGPGYYPGYYGPRYYPYPGYYPSPYGYPPAY